MGSWNLKNSDKEYSILESPLTFEGKKTESKWPILQKACEVGCLSFVDLVFAESLVGEEGELVAAFLCHLSRAVRAGHLCVLKKWGKIYPSPIDLWFSDMSGNDDCSDILELLERLNEEKILFPDHLMTHVTEGFSEFPLTPLCRFHDLYYFQKYFLFESSFVDKLTYLLKQSPEISIEEQSVSNKIKEMQFLNVLNPEQASAIKKGCHSCFSIICGGPGTGKTYTAGQFVRIFWESLSPERRDSCEIALTAPTGKAALNLQKSLEKAFPGESDVRKVMKAKTLHSLLGLKMSGSIGQRSEKKLNADLIIVDECSMIDVRLMSSLLEAAKPGVRLIFLGDPDQLPPVEVGSVFKDVVQCLPGHVCELKTCLRAELREIVDFSRMVNEGNAEGVIAILNKSPVVGRAPFPTNIRSKVLIEKVIADSGDRIPEITFREGQDLQELLDAFNRFRILSPLRGGHFGVVEINRLIHQERMPLVDWDEYSVAPIMILSNDYKIHLFNGETGILVSRKRKSQVFHEGDFAVFCDNEGKTYRKIPAILLPKFEYAYCLSVHKSQGSEFEEVFLLLPEGSEKFGREVLYTAVTRAKRKLQVWGTDDTIRQTIYNQSGRLSGIREYHYDLSPGR